MPQRLENLRAALAELENELQSLDSLDDETRTMLENASAEIQLALQESNPEPLEHQSLAQRLKQSVEEFETSHPTLSRVLERMVDVLGQMGI